MNDWWYMKILRLSKDSPPKPDEEIWSFGLFIVGFVVTVFMMNKILSIDLNYIIRNAFIGVPAFIVGCLLVYLQEIIRIIALLIETVLFLIEILCSLAFICFVIYMVCELVYTIVRS